jgi:hypothetical protein
MMMLLKLINNDITLDLYTYMSYELRTILNGKNAFRLRTLSIPNVST